MDAYYYKQTLRSYYTGPGLIRTNSNNGYNSSMLYAGQPLIKQSSSPTKSMSSSKSSYSPWNSSSSSYSSSNNSSCSSSPTWGNNSNKDYSLGSKKEEAVKQDKKNDSGGTGKSINFESNIGVFNRQRDLEIRISFG